MGDSPAGLGPDSGAEPQVVRRSRREHKKKRGSDALEKIRRSRETGVRVEAELEETEGVFDLVSEEEYARLVQDRQRDAWICDDDGSYREHGREIFDEEATNADSMQKKKEKKITRRVAPPSSDIKNMVMFMGSGKKRSCQGTASVKGDTLLSDLLNQITDEPHPPSKKRKSMSFTPRQPEAPPSPGEMFTVRHVNLPTKRVKKSKRVPDNCHAPSDRAHSPGYSPANGTYHRPPAAATGDHSPDDRGIGAYGDDDPANWALEEPGQFPAETPMEKAEQLVIESEDIMASKEELVAQEVQQKREAVPTAAVSCSGWETVREELAKEMAPPLATEVQDDSALPVRETEDGSVFSFFWLDAYEDPFHRPGNVYLFGKVLNDQSNTYVSCCVVVKNIQRCLYFLPREKWLIKSGGDSNREVTMQDVYTEFNEKYAEPWRILRFSTKRVSLKYAFEKPEVPLESEYLEVRYSAEHQAPPPTATGHTFSHVFGTNTSSIEHLLLSCKLKGPSWLHVKNPHTPVQKISWCSVECGIDSMKLLDVASEQAPPPPLVVLSLSVTTLLNARSRSNEILCVGGLVHRDVRLDKKAPAIPFQTDFCVIRRPSDRHFPIHFSEMAKRKGLNLEVTASERSLLAYFLAKLLKIDPDVVIGHNISSQWLDLLQHRLLACKVPQWSRVGRIKRTVPLKGKGSSQWLCCGRLVCDVKVSAKELIRARSYDLAELASSVLNVQYMALSQEDVLAAFNRAESLLGVVSHTMDEAMLALRLCHELNVLPLAYQITCIAGNVLSRTLQGGRSERNEYLLLHAFTSRNYLCPDRREGSNRHQPLAGSHDGDEEDDAAVAATTHSKSSRRKPAYAGGLVLEPKVGFYDRFILLLDFNSLYPSIIQEYNICFTTIDHAHHGDDDDPSALDLPGDSVLPGILPTEIRVLVERRRQVKAMLKSAASPEQRVQLDIRQKALKLTANSMYGCLGFAQSRFHAKPLAACVTSKGREILSHTKDLANKLGLDVIYGDTDSIMIDSGSRDLDQALQLAQKVKVEVNKLYRLLEIDVDGIFKSMLLLKKKKYAAITVEKKDTGLVEKKELKGLDIVRRDWSQLAKRAGNMVLDQILLGQPLEQLHEKVQTFLSQVSEELTEGRTNLSDLVITKSLTKLPQDYPDKKNLPHVQVALRMISRNYHVQPGDVIPYVICQGEQGASLAQRSFHPEEIAQQNLIPDSRYYLQHQVHAVVTRLCQPIEGLDAAQLASWLGLDPSAYVQRQTGGGEGEDVDHLLPTAGPTLVEGEPLVLSCPNKTCSALTTLGQGDNCLEPRCRECGSGFSSVQIRNSVAMALRGYVSRYYMGWLVCEDGTCSYRTRSTSLYCPACNSGNRLREEYSTAALYSQLHYFKTVFAKADKRVRLLIQDFVEHNLYTVVNLSKLFPTLRD